jgi:hypothetical protein
MEKLLTNELLKYLLILGAGAIAVMAVIARVVGKLKGSFKFFQRATIIYLLIFVLLFAVIALCGLPALFNSPMTTFIFLQVYFLLLGSCNVYFFNKHISWANDEDAFLPNMLFAILVCILGWMLFLTVYNMVNKNGFEFMLACAGLFFIVPFFFYHTFQKVVDIPLKIVKQWFYPVGTEIDEPDDLKHPMVISFEFQKQPGDKNLINFRAKAPRDMEFGVLFYHFINDYNAVNSSSQIQFIGGYGKPQGWIFYKKPTWYSLVTQYIDVDQTILANKIKENDVIICTRSQI